MLGADMHAKLANIWVKGAIAAVILAILAVGISSGNESETSEADYPVPDGWRVAGAILSLCEPDFNDDYLDAETALSYAPSWMNDSPVLIDMARTRLVVIRDIQEEQNQQFDNNLYVGIPVYLLYVIMPLFDDQLAVAAVVDAKGSGLVGDDELVLDPEDLYDLDVCSEER